MTYIFNSMPSRLAAAKLSLFKEPLWLIQTMSNEPCLALFKIVSTKRPQSESLPLPSNDTSIYSIMVGLIGDKWQVCGLNDICNCLTVAALSHANPSDLLTMLNEQGFKANNMLLPSIEDGYQNFVIEDVYRQDFLSLKFYDKPSNLPKNLMQLPLSVIPAKVVDNQSIIFGLVDRTILEKALLETGIKGAWLIRESTSNFATQSVMYEKAGKVVTFIPNRIEIKTRAKDMECTHAEALLISLIELAKQNSKWVLNGEHGINIPTLTVENLVIPSLRSVTDYCFWSGNTTANLVKHESFKGSNPIIDISILPSKVRELIFDEMPPEFMKIRLNLFSESKLNNKKLNPWVFLIKNGELLIVSCHLPDETMTIHNSNLKTIIRDPFKESWKLMTAITNLLLASAEKKGYQLDLMLLPAIHEVHPDFRYYFINFNHQNFNNFSFPEKPVDPLKIPYRTDISIALIEYFKSNNPLLSSSSTSTNTLLSTSSTYIPGCNFFKKEAPSKADPDFLRRLAEQLLCPITKKIMTKPVIWLGDFKTYEKEAIEKQLAEQNHANRLLVPNLIVEEIAKLYKQCLLTADLTNINSLN